MYYNYLEKIDPEVVEIIKRECKRQENKLELIASENFTSNAVMEACGSALTNKYAEGYPGKRYYGGCEHVDEVEELAIERGKKLFNAEFAKPGTGGNISFVAGADCDHIFWLQLPAKFIPDTAKLTGKPYGPY